ncbi:MAG: hypothetical protein ACRCTJ_01575 [Brevinema sp.]
MTLSRYNILLFISCFLTSCSVTHKNLNKNPKSTNSLLKAIEKDTDSDFTNTVSPKGRKAIILMNTEDLLDTVKKNLYSDTIINSGVNPYQITKLLISSLIPEIKKDAQHFLEADPQWADKNIIQYYLLPELVTISDSHLKNHDVDFVFFIKMEDKNTRLTTWSCFYIETKLSKEMNILRKVKLDTTFYHHILINNAEEKSFEFEGKKEILNDDNYKLYYAYNKSDLNYYFYHHKKKDNLAYILWHDKGYTATLHQI